MTFEELQEEISKMTPEQRKTDISVQISAQDMEATDVSLVFRTKHKLPFLKVEDF